ncbi:uncharacterized protein [Dermacentor andersoni]|uniref:uncharacterized protein n=1 Tax=Dermacentor andersoni TaxID=34620 RepID=UPI0024167EEF|nr:uncharacterized protein LOC129382371 [Dermacentor andersoni]
MAFRIYASRHLTGKILENRVAFAQAVDSSFFRSPANRRSIRAFGSRQFPQSGQYDSSNNCIPPAKYHKMVNLPRRRRSSCFMAHKLKEAARMSSTVNTTDSYFRQVEFLHYTIDPEGMRISGAGFVRLDKPFIVSIVGALITFTIILVQTGDELTHRLRDKAASTAS